MAEPKLQFELVAPEKLIISKQVAMVTVPGGEGDYGVLAGHAPMITTVKPGVIDVYETESTEPSERIFVAGGFAEVTASRCTVLADEAIPVSDLDHEKLKAEAMALVEKAATAHGDDLVVIRARQDVVMAKIAAAA